MEKLVLCTPANYRKFTKKFLEYSKGNGPYVDCLSGDVPYVPQLPTKTDYFLTTSNVLDPQDPSYDPANTLTENIICILNLFMPRALLKTKRTQRLYLNFLRLLRGLLQDKKTLPRRIVLLYYLTLSTALNEIKLLVRYLYHYRQSKLHLSLILLVLIKLFKPTTFGHYSKSTFLCEMIVFLHQRFTNVLVNFSRALRLRHFPNL
jgi:hypothetical protein